MLEVTEQPIILNAVSDILRPSKNDVSLTIIEIRCSGARMTGMVNDDDVDAMF